MESRKIVRCYSERCLVAPHPDLKKKLMADLAKAKGRARTAFSNMLRISRSKPVGMDDGLIFPGDLYPLGTSARTVRNGALDRAPLRGTVRVIVVLVDFSDKPMTKTKKHFEDLFFSIGVLPNGSVRDYYKEVTHGLIDMVGEVVGPFRMPKKLSEYAHGDSGTGNVEPNARTMAKDAADAANPTVNFAQYDNDGNGFVDAFVVLHAGGGAEQTGNVNDIWSHKWVLSGGAYNADGTKIYAYLTVPEDCKIGVCCHELGHLIFGWPDLYDTDYSSEGLGNWCLMAGGSWNGGGDIPAHPSAWCKVNQGWVSVVNQTTNQTVSITDVKTGYTVYRLWKDGTPGSEYFLVENRQKTAYDKMLPGPGLLVYHVDEAVSGNSNENHPQVALMQADGLKHLTTGANRGDAGDPYPGSANNVTFNATSNPNSKSYGNVDTCVSITNIGASGATMTARLAVKCKIKEIKEKERKEFIKEKERKEFIKEKDRKEGFKEIKEKEIKERKESLKEKEKDFKEIKEKDKDLVEGRPPGGLRTAGAEPNLEDRVSRLESMMQGIEPYITGDLRPDLRESALASESDCEEMQARMREGAAEAKRLYDSKMREG
ncbi:MAG: Putative protease [Nitrospira sp.]|jgi:immune inhibitor A|nr:MAG: Putative protease [Nitrospira sp.]